MGAPVGNKNAVGKQDTEKPFRDALRRAIAQDSGKRIRDTAEKLLDLAAAGEPWAVKELVDRTDGKAIQGVELGGPNGSPVQIEEIRRTIVDPCQS
jgi:hypothetical protein